MLIFLIGDLIHIMIDSGLFDLQVRMKLKQLLTLWMDFLSEAIKFLSSLLDSRIGDLGII